MSQTKSKTDLNRLAMETLDLLKKERSREVLSLRYGLGVEKATLEKIGQKYGITRERVRQIEKSAISRLKTQKLEENPLYKELFDLVKKQGIVLTSEIEKTFGKDKLNACRFILNLSPEIYEIHEDDKVNAGFAHESFDLKQILSVLKEAAKILKNKNEHLAVAELKKQIQESLKLEWPENAWNKIFDLSKELVVDNNEIGHHTWPTINPKSIKDKTHYVLRKHGEPLHFSHIAIKVKEISGKSITKQAVHNELIRDERFVLVGRGIYALAEWGYNSGTVTEIIEEILVKEKVLHKNDIIKKVLERRIVKETTIILNLQNKNKFCRVGKATYSIKG